MDTYATVLKVAMLFFIAMILLEWGLSRYLKKKVYQPMDTISGISSGITNNIKAIFKLSIIILSYDWLVANLALFEIQSSLLVYVIGFIGIDFASYWSHRWNHEFNVLWNRHIIHHSSEEFNLSAALRQSISGITQIFFFLYIPMAMLGVPTKVIAVIAPLHLFAQFWYHTRLIDKMGFLEYIIVTPSHHRVHHAINKEYLDKNYAAILIIWDKWFGTFQEELKEVPPVYGVKRAVRTWNPIIINFQHIWQLIKDAWRAEKLWDKIRIWFMPTGWRPADVQEKYPVPYTVHAKDQVKYNTPVTPFLIIWCIIQLALHVLVQFHLIDLLPILPYGELLLYGLFVILSVFSYTALMDRHWTAVPAEIIKTLLAFGLLYYYGGWFMLQEVSVWTTVLVISYLLFSFVVTLYYTYLEKVDFKILARPTLRE